MLEQTRINLDATSFQKKVKKLDKQSFSGNQTVSQPTVKFNQSKDIVSFGRAMAAQTNQNSGEVNILSRLLSAGKNELGIHNEMVILPSVTVPSKSGSGTLLSKYGKELVGFLAARTGINAVQDMPTGQAKDKGCISPFSGAVFALGVHIIDPEQLASPAYNNIVKDGDLSSILGSTYNASEVNYKGILGDPANSQDIGAQRKLMEVAFENFKALPDNAEVKTRYNDFVNNSDNDYIHKNAQYDVLSRLYGSTNMDGWSSPDKAKLNFDKNLYAKSTTPEARENRFAELKSQADEAFKSDLSDSKVKSFNDELEFSKFCQFIASEQLENAGNDYEGMGVKLFGDCLIGFSTREYWADRPAFMDEDGASLGCRGDGGKVNSWGTAAVDFNKEEAWKLQDTKLRTMAKRYNAHLRMDSGYQLSEPCVTKSENGKNKIIAEPKLKDRAYKQIENVLSQVKPGFEKEDVYFEMLGGPSGPVNMTKNEWPHSQITRYANPNWGTADFYLSNRNSNDHERNNTGYKPHGLYMGPGTHDDISLITQQKERSSEQKTALAEYLKLGGKARNKAINDPKESKNARFAELFTVRNPFFTIFDALGLDVKFNDNWKPRVPENYEETFYKNLVDGKGLNAPKAMSMALHQKDPGKYNDGHPLIKALDKASRILESNEIKTEDKNGTETSENIFTEKQVANLLEKGRLTEVLTEEDLNGINL